MVRPLWPLAVGWLVLLSSLSIIPWSSGAWSVRGGTGFDDATPLTTNVSANGNLAEGGHHMYSIAAVEGTILDAVLSIDNPDADFDLILYSPHRSALAWSYSVNRVEEIRALIEENGTYYLNVTSYSGSGGYLLTVSFSLPAPPDGNDDKGSATYLSPVSVNPGYIDGITDPDDWYAVNLSRTASQVDVLTVTLQVDLNGRFSVTVYDTNGTYVDSATTYDYAVYYTSVEVKAAAMEAGTYYIKVSTGPGSQEKTNYTLRLAVAQGALDTNNNQSQAVSLQHGKTVSGAISSLYDPEDWFRIPLASSGDQVERVFFSFRTTVAIAATLTAYDTSGRSIGYVSTLNPKDYTSYLKEAYLSVGLGTAGEVYLVVEATDGTTDYTLTPEVELVTSDGDNTFETARQVWNGDRVEGALDKAKDPVDYYKTHLAGGEGLWINLSGIDVASGADFDLTLYDGPDGARLNGSYSTQSTESAYWKADAGWYGFVYIRVNAYRGDGTYTISVAGDGNHRASVAPVSPTEGEVIVASNASLRWNASDADGDPLRFAVYLSANRSKVESRSQDVRVAEVSAPLYEARSLARGTYYWAVIPTDGKPGLGLYAPGVSSFEIRPNRPPTLTPLTPTNQSLTANETGSVVLEVQTSDPDGQAVTLCWLLDGRPIPGATGTRLTLEFNYSSAGWHQVGVEAADPMGATYALAWNVTVLDVNRPPLIRNVTPLAGSVDAAPSLTFDVQAFDPDGEPLDYAWWLDDRKVSSSKEGYTYARPVGDRSAHRLNLTISDANGGQVRLSWTINPLPGGGGDEEGDKERDEGKGMSTSTILYIVIGFLVAVVIILVVVLVTKSRNPPPPKVIRVPETRAMTVDDPIAQIYEEYQGPKHM